MSQILQIPRSLTNVPTTTELTADGMLAITQIGGVTRFWGRINGAVKELSGDNFAKLASPALTGTPTAPTPSAGDNSTTIATTAFVQTEIGNQFDGLSYKEPVRATSTANVAIATALENTDTLDGVTLATGDRVLLKNQTTASENGVYVVVASGAASRATDFDINAEVVGGVSVFVQEGTANGDQRYTLSTDGAIVLGTTNLTFVQTSGTGQVTDGDGLSKSGNTLNIDVSDFAGTGLEDDGSENLRLAAQGNGITGGAGSTLSVLADSTGGANLAKSINVSANGVAIKIDTVSVVENGSGQLEVGTIDGGTF